MSVRFKNYERTRDNQAIGDFLIANYKPDNADVNWLQPRWEYMSYRFDMLANIDTSKIGIWEDNEKIVAVAHPESYKGEVYIQVSPEYTYLKPEILNYAESELYGINKRGNKVIHVFVYDTDEELKQIVKCRGYQTREATAYDFLSKYTVPSFFPKINLPEGFRLISLEEENDPEKTGRLWWRGFNHPGEPPENQAMIVLDLQTAPNYRKNLNIVIKAANGDFVSYCGMWYVPANRYAYVEPVATDPDYREKGLASAAVLAGIRRCAYLGAKEAYVGTGTKLYEKIGFKIILANHWWEKRW